MGVTASYANVLGKTQVRLTFDGTYANTAGSLVDGNYELRIDGSKVVGDGKMMDGGSGPGSTHVDEFFRLYGDNDGNRVVNLFDFAAFRSTFGLQAGNSGYVEGFDSDDNDVINLFDFAAFRSNFGRTLDP